MPLPDVRTFGVKHGLNVFGIARQKRRRRVVNPSKGSVARVVAVRVGPIALCPHFTALSVDRVAEAILRAILSAWVRAKATIPPDERPFSRLSPTRVDVGKDEHGSGGRTRRRFGMR